MQSATSESRLLRQHDEGADTACAGEASPRPSRTTSAALHNASRVRVKNGLLCPPATRTKVTLKRAPRAGA
jgi:hypothetical protein